MPAMTRPHMVTIGPSALRSTCRSTISRSRIPDARATSTWSAAPASTIDCLVTRLIRASAPSARDRAGSVRWCTVPVNPSPLPVTGNQPSWTPKTATRAMAETKDGTEAARVVPPTTVESIQVPRRTAASTPAPTPRTTKSTVAYATRVSVVGKRVASRSATWSLYLKERPRSSWTQSPSQRPYCTTRGSSRWYWALTSSSFSGESLSRPPARKTAGSPGAAYTAAKMTKEAARSVASSPASRREIRASMRDQPFFEPSSAAHG